MFRSVRDKITDPYARIANIAMLALILSIFAIAISAARHAR